jgi:HK97 family phage major capsid protein
MLLKNYSRGLMGLLVALVMIALSSVGYALEPTDALLASALLVGDIDTAAVSELLEKQGKAFEEFKSANDARLKAVEEKGYAPADTVEKVEKINEELTKLGKEIAEIAKKSNRPGGQNSEAPEVAEHKAAVREFLRKGKADNLRELELKVYRRGSDVDGGYLIDSEMDTEITRIAASQSVIRTLAEVRTIGKSSSKLRVKTSGFAARWTGEGEAGGETDGAKYAGIEITPEEMEAEPWVYNSTLDDFEVDLALDLESEAGIAFGEAEAAAFVNGNGIKKPRGFLSYNNVANASYAWGSVGFIKSGKNGGFADTSPADKLIDLQHALKMRYRTGATMLMNDQTLALVRQMKDGSGQYYMFSLDPTGQSSGFVLGVPVQIDDNMPLIETGSYSIAYANWGRAYRIVDRKGIALIRDNLTEKGTTKFNFRKRVGGGVKNFEAIKLLKFSA